MKIFPKGATFDTTKLQPGELIHLDLPSLVSPRYAASHQCLLFMLKYKDAMDLSHLLQAIISQNCWIRPGN